MVLTTERIIDAIDTTLRTLFPPSHRAAERPCPGESLPETNLNAGEKRHVAGLMRVNHSGEVCAQALYQGQALTAQLEKIRDQMEQAAREEMDHLSWCEQRLAELSAGPSLLNPLWYTASFVIGALAGLAGDKYSLGFVEETERQVSAHLQNHIAKLPEKDQRSKAILDQMLADEQHHAEQAHNAGAAALPVAVQTLMGLVSKLMTRSSYYL